MSVYCGDELAVECGVYDPVGDGSASYTYSLNGLGDVSSELIGVSELGDGSGEDIEV